MTNMLSLNRPFSNTARSSRAARAFLCLLCSLAVAFSCAFPDASAFADVRKADIVSGQTVEQLGLSVSQCPDIDAAYAIVTDESGNVYFERESDSESKIASITKIMTAVVALDVAEDNTTVVVSDTAAAVGESTASLQSGDSMPLSTALEALLIPSGNDAAEAIAETVGAQLLEAQGGDSSSAAACSQAFVDAMNQKAEELGMTDTVYRNPHGLDTDEYAGDQHSTASDIATLCRYAMSNETFRSIVSQGSKDITVTRQNTSTVLSLEATDELIGVYDGACGIKTGYTLDAGACFAGASNRGDGDLYAIVLGSSDSQQRFDDAETLFDWVYQHRVQYSLINTTSTTTDATGASVPLVAEVAHTDYVDKTVKATVADPSQTVQIFDLDGNVSQSVEYSSLSGNVKAGQKVGTITYKQRNEVIATVDLVAAESVDAPGLFEGIGIWWQRFIGGFSGDTATAKSVCYNQTPLVNDKTATTS